MATRRQSSVRERKANGEGLQALGPEEKMRVVLAATAAGDAGAGEVLRREGLFDEDLERFKAELIAGPSGRVPRRDPADRKQIKSLERELRRKEKALAEAAALVVLSKKLNAYFDPDGVGEPNEENEK
jgi:transposase